MTGEVVETSGDAEGAPGRISKHVPACAIEFVQLLPELALTLYQAAPHERNVTLSGGKLTSRQMQAVIHLAHHPRTTMSGLAAGIGIGRAATTELVTRMEEMGVVRREHHERDRRVVIVSLVDQAEGYANELLAVWGDSVAATFEQFPCLDPLTVTEFLRALICRWKRAV